MASGSGDNTKLVPATEPLNWILSTTSVFSACGDKDLLDEVWMFDPSLKFTSTFGDFEITHTGLVTLDKFNIAVEVHVIPGLTQRVLSFGDIGKAAMAEDLSAGVQYFAHEDSNDVLKMGDTIMELLKDPKSKIPLVSIMPPPQPPGKVYPKAAYGPGDEIPANIVAGVR